MSRAIDKESNDKENIEKENFYPKNAHNQYNDTEEKVSKKINDSNSLSEFKLINDEKSTEESPNKKIKHDKNFNNSNLQTDFEDGNKQTYCHDVRINEIKQILDFLNLSHKSDDSNLPSTDLSQNIYEDCLECYFNHNLNNNLLLMVGCPGTGKTTGIEWILNNLEERNTMKNEILDSIKSFKFYKLIVNANIFPKINYKDKQEKSILNNFFDILLNQIENLPLIHDQMREKLFKTQDFKSKVDLFVSLFDFDSTIIMVIDEIDTLIASQFYVKDYCSEMQYKVSYIDLFLGIILSFKSKIKLIGITNNTNFNDMLSDCIREFVEIDLCHNFKHIQDKENKNVFDNIISKKKKKKFICIMNR